jgi:serine/threonine-protein kinase
MGRVYEAVHEDLQKTVALKVLGAQHMDNPVVVERFLREGRNASKVRHRNAIEVFDVGVDGNVVYLAMEYLQGEDLARRLHREGPLSATASVDLLLPAIAALAEAHDVGVIHRDLKPGNLFLAVDRRGRSEVRVLDFGIAKAVDDHDREHLTNVGVVIGTAFYLAPELVRGAQNASPASDQYALGVILYQCTSGQVPFRGKTPFETCELILRGDHVPLRLRVPTLPEGFDRVVARAMAIDPTARFPSLVAFGAALLPYASFAVQVQWAPTFGVEVVGILTTPYVSTPPPALTASGAFPVASPSDFGVAAPPSLVEAAMTPEVTTRDISLHPSPPTRSRTVLLAAAITFVVLALLTIAIQRASHVVATSPAVSSRRPTPFTSPERPAEGPGTPIAPATAPSTAPAPLPLPPVTQMLQSASESASRRERRNRSRRDARVDDRHGRPSVRVERTPRGGFIIR